MPIPVEIIHHVSGNWFKIFAAHFTDSVCPMAGSRVMVEAMQIKSGSGSLSGGLGVVGTGAIGAWPERHWIGYLFMAAGFFVLLFDVHIEHGRIEAAPLETFRRRVGTMGPQLLIAASLIGLVIGVYWYVRSLAHPAIAQQPEMPLTGQASHEPPKIERDIARRAFLTDSIGKLNATLSNHKEQSTRIIKGYGHCPNGGDCPHARIEEWKGHIDPLQQEIVSLVRDMTGVGLDANSTCGRDMNEPYVEEDDMTILSSHEKYDYRRIRTQYECFEGAIQSSIDAAQKEIDSINQEIEKLGRAP